MVEWWLVHPTTTILMLQQKNNDDDGIFTMTKWCLLLVAKVDTEMILRPLLSP